MGFGDKVARCVCCDNSGSDSIVLSDIISISVSSCLFAMFSDSGCILGLAMSKSKKLASVSTEWHWSFVRGVRSEGTASDPVPRSGTCSVKVS